MLQKIVDRLTGLGRKRRDIYERLHLVVRAGLRDDRTSPRMPDEHDRTLGALHRAPGCRDVVRQRGERILHGHHVELSYTWLNAWGVLLLGGVIVVGILIPLLLHWRPRLIGPDRSAAVGAFLVLVGGFLFRVVVVLSSDGIRRPM